MASTMRTAFMLTSLILLAAAPVAPNAAANEDLVLACTGDADANGETCQFVCVPGMWVLVFFEGEGSVSGDCSFQSEPPVPGSAAAGCSTSGGTCTASDGPILHLTIGRCSGTGDGTFGCSLVPPPVIEP